MASYGLKYVRQDPVTDPGLTELLVYALVMIRWPIKYAIQQPAVGLHSVAHG